MAKSWNGGLVERPAGGAPAYRSSTKPSGPGIGTSGRAPTSTPSAGRLLFSPQTAKASDIATPQVGNIWAGQAAQADSKEPLAAPLAAHCGVIRRLNRTKFGTHNQPAVKKFQELSTLRFSSTPSTELLYALHDSEGKFGALKNQGFTSAADVVGYRTCLELLGDMATGGADDTSVAESNQAGFFAPLCLSADAIAADRGSSLLQEEVYKRRGILTCGAKIFFERQFNDLMTERLTKDGELLDQARGSSRFMQLCVFIDIKGRTRGFPRVCMETLLPGDTNDTAIPLWPFLCTCLRVGDLEMAVEVLEAAFREGIAGVEEAIYIALNGFLELQCVSSGTEKTRRDSPLRSAEYRNRFRTAIEECFALFSDAQHLLTSTSQPGSGRVAVAPAYYDPYRMDFLNFLSLASVSDISDDLSGSTLEEYLWCNLWFMHWTRTVVDSDVMPPTGNKKGISSRYFPARYRYFKPETSCLIS